MGVLVRDGGGVATSQKVSCKHKPNSGKFMKLKLYSESDKARLVAAECTVKREIFKEDLRGCIDSANLWLLPLPQSWIVRIGVPRRKVLRPPVDLGGLRIIIYLYMFRRLVVRLR